MFTQETTGVSPILIGRRQWLLAEVVFGSPKKRCAGVGICSMNPLSTEPANSAFPCQKVLAQLSVQKPQRFILRLVKQGLCPNLAERQFPQNQFKLPRSFRIPDSICKRLKIQNASIPAGTYQVEESEEGYSIYMNLE